MLLVLEPCFVSVVSLVHKPVCQNFGAELHPSAFQSTETFPPTEHTAPETGRRSETVGEEV